MKNEKDKTTAKQPCVGYIHLDDLITLNSKFYVVTTSNFMLLPSVINTPPQNRFIMPIFAEAYLKFSNVMVDYKTTTI